jgi:hypothetical protein
MGKSHLCTIGKESGRERDKISSPHSHESANAPGEMSGALALYNDSDLEP